MINAEVHSEVIDQFLRRLSNAVTNLRPAMDDIGQSIGSSIQQRLGRGETPWGDPFATLSEAYMREVPRRRGGIPLNDTRKHIYKRIAHNATDTSVEIGMNDGALDAESPAGLGQMHQFGLGRNPARPFMPIRNGYVDLPQSWEANVVETILRHINRAV